MTSNMYNFLYPKLSDEQDLLIIKRDVFYIVADALDLSYFDISDSHRHVISVYQRKEILNVLRWNT